MTKKAECSQCHYKGPKSVSRPGLVVYFNGVAHDTMCKTHLDETRATWKDYKVRIVLDQWMFDDNAEDAISSAKDDPDRDAVVSAEVVETRDIKITSEWDEIVPRARLALEAGDPDEALRILREGT